MICFPRNNNSGKEVNNESGIDFPFAVLRIPRIGKNYKVRIYSNLFFYQVKKKSFRFVETESRILSKIFYHSNSKTSCVYQKQKNLNKDRMKNQKKKTIFLKWRKLKIINGFEVD